MWTVQTYTEHLRFNPSLPVHCKDSPNTLFTLNIGTHAWAVNVEDQMLQNVVWSGSSLFATPADFIHIYTCIKMDVRILGKVW